MSELFDQTVFAADSAQAAKDYVILPKNGTFFHYCIKD